MKTFKDIAPKYFKKGIPVVPVKGKRPTISTWYRFSERMPTQEEQEFMLKKYPDADVAIVLGECSDLMCLDIECSKITIEQAIGLKSMLISGSHGTTTPNGGVHMVYQRNPKVKNANIRNNDGDIAVEIMSNARIKIISPALGYNDGGVSIADIKNEIPALPNNIQQMIEGVIKNAA